MWLQTRCVYAPWPSGFGSADPVIKILTLQSEGEGLFVTQGAWSNVLRGAGGALVLVIYDEVSHFPLLELHISVQTSGVYGHGLLRDGQQPVILSAWL